MTAHENVRPALPMPIKATPYRHQIEAFNFVCGLFGLLPGGERDGPSKVCLLREGNQQEAKSD